LLFLTVHFTVGRHWCVTGHSLHLDTMKPPVVSEHARTV